MKHPVELLQNNLQGKSGFYLTVVLLVCALIIVSVALFGNKLMKVFTAVWIILP